MIPTESLGTGSSPSGLRGGFESLAEVVVPVNYRELGTPRLPEQVFHFGEGDQEEQPLYGLPMEREGPGGELLFDTPLLLVCGEFPVFGHQLLAGFIEPLFDVVDGTSGFSVVDGDLDESPLDESSFDRTGLGGGKATGDGTNLEDPEVGFFSRHVDLNVEFVPSRPIQQLVGRVAPLESERWFQDGLSTECRGHDQPAKNKKFRHAGIMARSRSRNKVRRGSILIEATYALTFLTGLSLVLLKLAISVTAPRQWTLQQSITDAYLTYEKAYAQRLPFSELLGGDSPWPAFPSKAESNVELGKLPGGEAISAKVIRTRTPDSNNLPIDGGSGSELTNPAGMKVWKFQSLLIYEVGDREYVKSRTVVRSQ